MVFGLALSWAQGFDTLLPPGSVIGLGVRDLTKQSDTLEAVQAEWERLEMNQRMAAILPSDQYANLLPLLSLGTIQQGAAVALYPDGAFVALFQPDTDGRKALAPQLKAWMPNPVKSGEWQVQETPELTYADNGRVIMVAAPSVYARFAAGERGGSFPAGDIVMWIEPQAAWPLLESMAGMAGPESGPLVQNLLQDLRIFSSYTSSSWLEAKGIRSQSTIALDQAANPELAQLFLPEGQPWPLTDLPQGMAATSAVFDLPFVGSYISGLLGKSGINYNLDLSAFGTRVATVTIASAAPTSPTSFLGDQLFFIEAVDPPTAAAILTTWLQQLAAFATPEGQGGFALRPIEGGNAINVGILGEIYLLTQSDRLVLATSEKALAALSGPKFKNVHDPKGAASVSYSDTSAALGQEAQALTTALPMAVSDPASMQGYLNVAQGFQEFLEFLSQHSGSSTSTGKVQDGKFVTDGFWEVEF